MATDVSSLHTALEYVCSQDHMKLKIGEEKLLSWEDQPGYYSGLTSIFVNRQITTDIRWMAITCLKNAIDKHWRPKIAYSVGHSFIISDEEKQLVRSTLLACIEEPEDKISAQLGLVIGRIARTDCPNSWPELLPFLTEGVRCESVIRQKCCLVSLRDVIKAFSSWRVTEHKRIFYEVTSSLFQYVFQVWTVHLSSLSEIVSMAQLEKVTESLSLAAICLKILQLLLLHGFARFNADAIAVECVEQFHHIAPQLLKLRSQLHSSHSAYELLEKVTTMLLKTLFKLQSLHPIGYVQFVGSSFQLVHSTVFNQDLRQCLYNNYLIYGLHILKRIFTTQDYVPPITQGIHDITPPPQVYEVNQLKSNFYTTERLQDTIKQLVTEFMILSDEEIEEWQYDPELYAAPEDATGKNYVYSKKASVESTLIAIVHTMPNNAVPILINLLGSVQGTGPSADIDSLLKKEAVLNALGLTAFDCYELFDFETWFKTSLINELSITDPRYKVVRRRLVWLLGNWVPIKFDNMLRPLLYRTLIPILHENEDIVIRLSAAEALRQVIDDISFISADFAPFISDTMQLLLKLLKDVQDSTTKLIVMKVFSQMIEMVGQDVRPHVGSLLEQVPRLWSEAEGDNSSLLQCVIIATLTHVVNSLGELSVQLHSFLLPIINFSVDMQRPEHVYLAEEGLQLWFAVVSQAVQPTMDLILLFSNIKSLLGLSGHDDSVQSLEGLLDDGSTSFNDCFEIIDVYSVLCADSAKDAFLQHCIDIAVRACHAYIRNMTKDSDVRAIVAVVDRLMVLYCGEGGHRLLEPVLLDLIRCALNQEESRTSVLCLYLGLLARSMLCDAQHFISMIGLIANESQFKINELLGLMLDVWTEKLDNIGDPRQRKLFGLAAASLLTVDDICVIERFGLLMDMCVEVLHDVTDTSTTGGTVDLLMTRGVDAYEEYNRDRPHPSMDTEHGKRIRKFHSIDHLWCVSLPNLLAQQLETCLTNFGYERYQSLLKNVDVVIREQCHEFLPPSRAHILLCLMDINHHPT